MWRAITLAISVSARSRTPSREADRRKQVVGTLACMVGGLILARAVGGKESTKVLEACRGFLHRTLGDAPADETKPTARHGKTVKAREAPEARSPFRR